MDAIDSGDDSDDEPISTEMLGDIRDGIQYHKIVNRRYARYKIRNIIKRCQAEWKGELLSTRNMGKYLHKLFKASINDI